MERRRTAVRAEILYTSLYIVFHLSQASLELYILYILYIYTSYTSIHPIHYTSLYTPPLVHVRELRTAKEVVPASIGRGAAR